MLMNYKLILIDGVIVKYKWNYSWNYDNKSGRIIFYLKVVIKMKIYCYVY